MRGKAGEQNLGAKEGSGGRRRGDQPLKCAEGQVRGHQGLTTGQHGDHW